MALKMLVKKEEQAQASAPKKGKKKLVDMTEATLEQQLTYEYLLLHQIYTDLEIKKTVDRMESIRKHLQLIATENFPPDKPVTFECNDGSLTFSPCTETVEFTHPSKVALSLLAMGEEVADACLTVRLTDLRKVLTEEEIKKISKKTYGSRKLSSVEHEGK
jgi:hypothetical protein